MTFDSLLLSNKAMRTVRRGWSASNHKYSFTCFKKHRKDN